jgi:hypothetical protein
MHGNFVTALLDERFARRLEAGLTEHSIKSPSGVAMASLSPLREPNQSSNHGN